MDLMDESQCASSTPIVKIVPMRPSKHGKPSNFSVLHKASRQSDGTCFSEEPAPDSECRICLEANNGTLIKPCKCTGTVEFVHENCLREWIRTKSDKNEAKIACELCQTDYNYDKEQDKRFECAQLLVSWKKKKRGVMLYMALECTALFLLGGLIALTMMAGDDEALRAKLMPSQLIKLAYAMATLLCSLFAVFMAVLFVGEFCVRHQVAIKVHRYVPPRHRSSLRKERNSLVHI